MVVYTSVQKVSLKPFLHDINEEGGVANAIVSPMGICVGEYPYCSSQGAIIFGSNIIVTNSHAKSLRFEGMLSSHHSCNRNSIFWYWICQLLGFIRFSPMVRRFYMVDTFRAALWILIEWRYCNRR
jgi:hypothetical protein